MIEPSKGEFHQFFVESSEKWLSVVTLMTNTIKSSN